MLTYFIAICTFFSLLFYTHKYWTEGFTIYKVTVNYGTPSDAVFESHIIQTRWWRSRGFLQCTHHLPSTAGLSSLLSNTISSASCSNSSASQPAGEQWLSRRLRIIFAIFLESVSGYNWLFVFFKQYNLWFFQLRVFCCCCFFFPGHYIHIVKCYWIRDTFDHVARTWWFAHLSNCY